jgi:hypothetical protein
MFSRQMAVRHSYGIEEGSNNFFLMDTSTLTLDDLVDILLHKMALAPNLSMQPNELYEVTVMNENTYHVDHFMIEKGLIKITRDGRTLTGKGLEISNFGGWIAYKRQLKKEKVHAMDGINILHRRLEKDIVFLKSEIERQKDTINKYAIKESATGNTIRHLIEQSRTNKLFYFLGGMLAGMVLSGILWYLIF